MGKAIMYNSLNPTHQVGMFTDRDDVEHGEYFEFQIEYVEE